MANNKPKAKTPKKPTIKPSIKPMKTPHASIDELNKNVKEMMALFKEASEETGYHSEWLRKLIRKYSEAINPPFEFVKKGGIWLIEPGSLREYAESMQKRGKGKHDPTRKPRKG